MSEDKTASDIATVLTHAQLYSAPWHERLPNGELNPEPYGPPSPSALARQVAKAKDWSWRVSKPSKEAQKPDAEALAMFMAVNADKVPEGERRVYKAIYLEGHAIRWCARQWGVRRETVKSWLKRLRARLWSSVI